MDIGQPSEQTFWPPSRTGNSRTSTKSKETDLIETELLPSSFKALLSGAVMLGLISVMHIFESKEEVVALKTGLCVSCELLSKAILLWISCWARNSVNVVLRVAEVEALENDPLNKIEFFNSACHR